LTPAIARRFGNHFAADDVVGAGPVIHHDILAECRAEFLRHDAANHIDRAIGGYRHHQPNRAAGVGG
jgi:hypothetical protein